MTKAKSTLYPLIIIGILFFVFGFLTWINGILIPYLQICLELTNFQATLVVFASYAAYFVMAIPSAWVLQKTGYKKGMVIGLNIVALGTLLFVPAAYTRTYGIFLFGLFVTGSGLTLLQTAANPYIAVLGPIEGNAQRIGYMGLSNKLAGILCIAILGSLFLMSADSVLETVDKASLVEKNVILDTYALKVVSPYIAITLGLVALSVMIYFSKLPEINEEESVDYDPDINSKQSVFDYPYLILGIFTLFCSSAIEAVPIDGIILYARAIGMSISEARHFTAYTLWAMIGGYIFSTIAIPKYISQQKTLQFCAIYGIVLTIGSFVLKGEMSLYCLVLMGFGGAMLWGTIWGLALRGLGRHTKMAGGMMLMAVIGGGIFPVIYGKLLDMNAINPQNAILMLIPCNLVLFIFASKWYKMESWK